MSSCVDYGIYPHPCGDKFQQVSSHQVFGVFLQVLMTTPVVQTGMLLGSSPAWPTKGSVSPHSSCAALLMTFGLECLPLLLAGLGLFAVPCFQMRNAVQTPEPRMWLDAHKMLLLIQNMDRRQELKTSVLFSSYTDFCLKNFHWHLLLNSFE